MIHVIATVELHQGAASEFLEHFRTVVPLVLREDGCLDYGPTQDFATNIPAQGEPRPDVVTVVEKWESLECLEAHLVAPHMLEYRSKVKHLVRSTALQVLQPV